jgi:RHS repeat-associated protein
MHTHEILRGKINWFLLSVVFFYAISPSYASVTRPRRRKNDAWGEEISVYVEHSSSERETIPCCWTSRKMNNSPTTGAFSIRQNPYKYSNYYFDNESALYYCQARYYSSELARFINRDTYNVQNRYAYCNGNPISNTDANGHISANVIIKMLQVISAIGGVAPSIVLMTLGNKEQFWQGLATTIGTAVITIGLNTFLLCLESRSKRTIADPLSAQVEKLIGNLNPPCGTEDVNSYTLSPGFGGCGEKSFKHGYSIAKQDGTPVVTFTTHPLFDGAAATQEADRICTAAGGHITVGVFHEQVKPKPPKKQVAKTSTSERNPLLIPSSPISIRDRKAAA